MKKILFFALLISLTGCTPFKYSSFSHHDILESAKTVQVSDGVDQDEAILLALKTILEKGLADRLYNLEPFKVEEKNYFVKDGKEIILEGKPASDFQPAIQTTWTIFFRDKKESWFWGLYPVIPFYVAIDGNTGSILSWGLMKK